VSAFRLVAIVEGPSDCRCLAFLVAAWRRHRCAELDWVDEATFGLGGLHDGELYLDLHQIPRRARERRIPRLRGGEEGLVRQGLLLVQAERPNTDGVVYLRDTDGAGDLGDTLRAANVKDMVSFRVALGFPHECIEAWVITGHAPSEGERRRESQVLGFDPFAHAAYLSHKENVPKSAKALKDRLEIGHDQEEAAMTRLVYLVCEGAGAESAGWSTFVRELDTVLAPLVKLGPLDTCTIDLQTGNLLGGGPAG
jgi:hypothetical protein